MGSLASALPMLSAGADAITVTPGVRYEIAYKALCYA
jgi:hypothetical protein